eukprot:TRINITY_DN12505_c0_g1_i1.p1 TRINITY_DN12505_c0_g1~~TRINITY_DN12505_c0_g1_i1.p1  ORF type:complete len:519 (+),score=131.78 TRINITY_DN12505_c0_g1_i1:182-1738(+)
MFFTRRGGGDNSTKNGDAPSSTTLDGGNPMPKYSPSRWCSPPTHLRRCTPSAKAAGKVSPDTFLTTKMAEFGKCPGVATQLDQTAFVSMLRSLIGESKKLQNNPRLGITPQEKLAAAHVMRALQPYSTKAGGPLHLEELEYVPGRSNLKITYKGTTQKTTSFVGSHFDVVPADPETWNKDPFSLTEEDGKLYGRGTTDCLGHVALLTCFLIALAKAKPVLKRTIVVLFIAGEEGGESGVGIDACVNAGKIEECKKGPVYWVDCADSQPCCGTLGVMQWSLTCRGRLFHSGFPHKGINSIELANEAVSIIQSRFYDDFPPNPAEEAYQFATGSHMKPTQIECQKGSTNQICPECTVHGDIRLSPFYEVEDVMAAIELYVKELNADMEELPVKGPYSKFVLGPDIEVAAGERKRGEIEFKWNGSLELAKLYAGVACSLTSESHKAIVQAHREVFASVKPFSISGSLPLVNMMHKSGFDIQLCGFGLMKVYHGVDEYCTVADMAKAYEVVLRTICLLEAVA